MDEDYVEKVRKQHLDNYKNALIEIIENNSNALVEDDISSLIKKPPLDSMDLLRAKFLDLAKKYNIVLNTTELDNILEHYRKSLLKDCKEIKNIRIKELSDIVNNKKISGNEVIILYKKDFVSLNKSIRKIIKEGLINNINELVINKCFSLFQDDIDEKIQDKFKADYTKYFKSNYQKQFLDSFDIKVLVKDTTLINSVKEQSERYLFTLNHSRLLNELE